MEADGNERIRTTDKASAEWRNGKITRDTKVFCNWWDLEFKEPEYFPVGQLWNIKEREPFWDQPT